MIPDTLTFQQLAVYVDPASDDVSDKGFLFLKRDLRDGASLCERLFRSEVFCILLCVRGEVSLSVDLNRYDIRRNTLLLIRPGSQFVVHACRDFALRCVVFDPAIRLHIPIPACDVAELQLHVIRNPVVSLAAGERLQLRRLFYAFRAVMAGNRNSARGRVVLQHAIVLLLYAVSDLLQPKTEPRSLRSARTRRDEYFCRFIEMLSRYYTAERSVAFYADKLNLTPKYLTTVIREVSGRTASEWIDDVIVQEACNRLVFSENSIQQIAYELNFPNQSFFGAFFKNKTGVSPSAYRQKNMNRS